MKYFLDTEFIEGFRKPLFGRKRHFIDLISIGIVSENNTERFFVSKEFDLKYIWFNKDRFVKDNVLFPLFNKIQKEEYHTKKYDVNYTPRAFTYRGMKSLIKSYGESNYDIATYIMAFIGTSPEFYGYYSDYDWVLFCSLFGRMIDLPSGYPMFCLDLKQMMEERGLDKDWKRINCPDPEGEHDALADAKWNKTLYSAIINETNTK